MPNVLLAVGDMAGAAGSNPGSAKTAALVKSLIASNPGSALLVLGDNAYNDGTTQEYTNHYSPAWGEPSIKPVTFPCPGNHDYHTTGAGPYFTFFGAQAGPAGGAASTASIATAGTSSRSTPNENSARARVS